MSVQDEKLDQIIGALGEVNVLLARMEQVQVNQTEKIHEHGITLYGNGRIGLKQQVENNARDAAAQIRFCNGVQANKPGWIRQFAFKVGINLTTIVLAGVIAAVFSAIIAQQVAAALMKLGH